MPDTRYEIDIWNKPGRPIFYDQMQEIIDDTEYRGARGQKYTYELSQDVDGDVFVTLVVTRPETFSGEISDGRTWRRQLTTAMSESQIVKLLFGMGKDYDEHECREGFTYKGRRVFGPHIDIAQMWAIAERYEQREDGHSDWRALKAQIEAYS